MSVGNSDFPPNLDPSAAKAYAHPLRIEILRYLNDHGAATATQLAKHLDQSSGQTSYHLRQLAKHGMVEDDPDRGTGRERWWRAKPFRFDGTSFFDDPAMRSTVHTVMSELVRTRAKTLEEWVRSDAPVELIKNSLHSQTTFDLTLGEMADLGTELLAVIDRYREASKARHSEEDGDDTQRVRIYVDIFPLLGQPDIAESGPQSG